MGWQQAGHYRRELGSGTPAPVGAWRVHAFLVGARGVLQWMISICPRLRDGSGNRKAGCNIASPRIANAPSLGCNIITISVGARDGTKANTKR
jgi:hypothetical protein